MKNRETLGKIVYDLAKKQPDSRDPIEIGREMQKTHPDLILKEIEKGKKRFPYMNFYLVTLLKKHRFTGAYQPFFFPRLSAPTPEYDQTVQFYNYKQDDLIYIWTLPSIDTCEMFYYNQKIIVPEEQEVLRCVLAMYDGTLMKLVKRLNGEANDSLLIVDTPLIIA
jgi:hypothetical protein